MKSLLLHSFLYISFVFQHNGYSSLGLIAKELNKYIEQLYFIHVKFATIRATTLRLSNFFSCVELFFVRKISRLVQHQISMFIHHFEAYFTCCQVIFKKVAQK